MKQKFSSLRQYLPTIILLLMGGMAVVYIGVSIAAQLDMPSDGVLLTELTLPALGVATPLLPDSDVLLVKDEILRIEGNTISEWVARAWRGEVAPHWQVGQRIVYQVRRDRQLIDVSVSLISFPWDRLPLMRFSVYGLAIVSLVVAIFILIRRPNDAAAQLLYQAAVCMTLVLCLHSQVMTLVTPWLFVTENIIKWLSRALLFSAILHLFLIFPVSKIRSRPVTHWLWLIHLVNPLTSVLIGMLLEQSPVQRWMMVLQSTSWIGLLMMVGGIASMLHTYVTVREPAVLGQIRWMALGSLVGILPYLIFTGLPEVMSGRAILTIEITSLFIVALPVTIGIAVARYRLFDVDLLIWQILLHTLFGLLMIGVYLLLRNAISALVLLITGAVDRGIIIFVASVLAVSAFWILRPYVLRLADRFLYRLRLHPQRILTQITQQLTSAIRLEQLAVLLAQDLPQQLGSERGGLMVLREDHQALRMVGGDDFTLPLDERFDLWRSLGNTPILRSVPLPEVPDNVLALMDARNVELIIPLQVGEILVGVLSLGPRAGALSYTTSEIRMLVLLARQAALAVQNALLVRQMEAHQQDLQQEVASRTQVMESDRNRLNAILQNIADGLLVTDVAGKIQLVNPAFEDLVRRSARSLIGHSIQQVLPLPELLDVLQRALEHPGQIEVARMTLTDPRLVLVDNSSTLSERVLKASATVLGDLSSVICILRDITHEVEVDRMKSEFVSAVSHEMRTPLTAILGFAKLIHRTFNRAIQPELPEEKTIQTAAQRIDKNLEILLREGERLTTLINDVLDIAALDAGTIEWHEQPCKFRPIIEQTVEQLRSEVEQKGLVIRTIYEDTVLMMHADPQRLGQVVANLISNAVKFTEQGEITVSTKLLSDGTLVHGWQPPSEGGVLLSVADTGIGIPAADLGRIFERFSQGGDPMLSKPKGTGLGLAISREIVYHYGGKIWAESEEGVGSTFYVALPLSR